jgi:hypothetical protein
MRALSISRMAVSLSVLALAGLVCGGATAARAGSATAARAGDAAAGRAAVPWHSVGKGWILADAASSVTSTGPGTLYLVSPGGQRYRVGQAPANATLEDWSGNGTDALFLPKNLNSATAPITVLNLRTMQASSFRVSSNSAFPGISFSRPDGTAILFQPGTTSGGANLPLERFSLTGTLELSYPAKFGRAGAFNGGFLENASGTELVFSTSNGLEVVLNDGQPVRFIAGYGPYGCQLLNWWNNQSVLANCDGQLLAYPLSGGRPDRLTSSRDGAAFLSGWQLPSGTYAEAAACGSTWLERLNQDGTDTVLTIPGAADAGTVQPLGTYGDQLPLLVGGGCDGHFAYSFVDFYNPAANVARTVLGGPAGGGYVTGAVMFGEGRVAFI